jgi:CxxC-x17-CxxC domain-containing protein
MNDNFQDKQLVCKDCSKEFVWTAGEQQFFAQKGFQNSPTRCPDCRRANKQRQAGPRQMFNITCSDCGKQGEVPFQPRDPSSPVYCADCFRARRGISQDQTDEVAA